MEYGASIPNNVYGAAVDNDFGQWRLVGTTHSYRVNEALEYVIVRSMGKKCWCLYKALRDRPGSMHLGLTKLWEFKDLGAAQSYVVRTAGFVVVVPGDVILQIQKKGIQ